VKRSTKIMAGAAVAAAVAGGAGVAAAGGPSEPAETPDPAISGDALQKAEAAALAETGGGQVTGTETEDEESSYEVEVTMDDGRQVDVQLDQSFAVVGSDQDGVAETDTAGEAAEDANEAAEDANEAAEDANEPPDNGADDVPGEN
jgi:hypothetical protein